MLGYPAIVIVAAAAVALALLRRFSAKAKSFDAMTIVISLQRRSR